MARSLNKATLIGNLTRDPEMKFTPQGHAVTTFGLATNRDWKVEGDKREETEFHNIVAWNKLAELCNQLLKKGTKIYVEGRLQTRDWVDEKGAKHYRTEIVAEDMIVLSAKKEGTFSNGPESAPKPAEKTEPTEDFSFNEDVSVDEIPL